MEGCIIKTAKTAAVIAACAVIIGIIGGCTPSQDSPQPSPIQTTKITQTTATVADDGEHTTQTTDTTASAVVATTSATVTEAPDKTTHTVTFRDFNLTVLKVEEVSHGAAATPPTPPIREGYLFAGWDRDVTKVTSSMVVTAQYVLPTAPMLVVSNVTAAAGETVAVDVSIANNPGLLGAILTYTFDPKLTLTDAKAGPAFDALNVSFPPYGTPFTVFCDGLTEAAKEDGVVMRLTFTVPTDAVSGQTFAIIPSHHPGDVVDDALKEVELIMVAGTVTVQ